MTTIAEVITALDNIIANCRQRQSALGYFAILYRQMTIAVQQGITERIFDDNARMEKLDVVFASRYLHAFQCYHQQQPCTHSWQTAFDAAANNNLAVIQHLILGINTHINLDLSIAAAETAAGANIFELQKDYDRINAIIAATAGDVQAKLERIWWPMKMLTRLASNKQDAVINFSVEKARQVAWANAVALSAAPLSAKDGHIRRIDLAVNAVANRITHPGLWLTGVLKLVRKMESKEVTRNLDILRG